MLDLKALKQSVKESLRNETRESLTSWLDSLETQEHLAATSDPYYKDRIDGLSQEFILNGDWVSELNSENFNELYSWNTNLYFPNSSDCMPSYIDELIEVWCSFDSVALDDLNCNIKLEAPLHSLYFEEFFNLPSTIIHSKPPDIHSKVTRKKKAPQSEEPFFCL